MNAHKGGSMSRLAARVAALFRRALVAANRFEGALLFLLVASAGLNVVLAYQLRAAERLLQFRAYRSESPLQMGLLLSPVRAVRLHDGAADVIWHGASGKPTLIYAFSPHCYWSGKNVPGINNLVRAIGDTHNVVGLSLSTRGLGEWLKLNDMRLTIWIEPDPDAIGSYRLNYTPTTLVISPEGRVIRYWTGAYTDAIVEEMSAHFGVALTSVDLAIRRD